MSACSSSTTIEANTIQRQKDKSKKKYYIYIYFYTEALVLETEKLA